VTSAADEGRHPPGAEPGWEESWWFDFTAADGSLGGYARIALQPARRRAAYWAALVGDGRPLVTVVDHEAPAPAPPGLEVRAEGLWCDHICETPLEHWTLGLEAFGVALDDPDEVFGRGHGDLVALGYDLEWETAGEIETSPAGAGYHVPCLVHGDVLVGRERLAVDAHGTRSHRWGEPPWAAGEWSWAAGRLGDGTFFHHEPADGGPLAGITPRHRAPVRLSAPDDRVEGLDVSLCRFDAGAGPGHGWAARSLAPT
jgi:hypothetical protein